MPSDKVCRRLNNRLGCLYSSSSKTQFPYFNLACFRKIIVIRLRIDRIFIDGNKPKSYTRRLKKVLRDKAVSVKTLRTINDQAMPAIRLADAIAGLCRYHYDQPGSRAQPLYKLIKSKIKIVIEI